MKANILCKMLLAAALVAAAGAANAEYATIFWRVGESSKADTFAYLYAGVTYAPTAAGLGSDYLLDASEIGSGGGSDQLFVEAGTASAPGGVMGALPIAGVIDDYGSYNFRIDLFGDDDNLLAVSGVQTLDQLRANWACVATGLDTDGYSVWEPTFRAVPEPTSGLLLLMGLAGLALKRKRS